MRRPGLALVLVVGVLGVLAVMGSAFAVLSRLERRAAVQRVLGTRAYLLARSGLEDAMARLDAEQDPDQDASRYGGENWDASADLKISVFEAGLEVYRRTGAGTPADIESCPVRHALRPSFFVRMGSGNPVLTGEAGRQRGYTGRLGKDASLHYGLKISSGGIFVNGGDPVFPATGATAGYNAVLRRILGSLAEAMDRDNAGANDGVPVDQADGRNLIDRRPRTSRGWESWEQIRDLALGGNQFKLDTLKPFLTLQAWTDRKVIAASAVNTQFSNMASGSDIIRGWSDFWGQCRSAVPDFERIGGRIVGRAPVDLSWARRRRPVLIALMDSLRGFYLNERYASVGDEQAARDMDQPNPNVIGKFDPSTAFTLNWTMADDCRAAADAVLASTSELRTWEQWNAFCDTLNLTAAGADAAVVRQAKRDALKANFNPNSDLNKFNPDASMARLVDKEDFWTQPSTSDKRYSTEFNLVPRRGGRIAAVGRVLGRDGRLLASRELSAELMPDRIFRMTTQSEFVAGDLGRPDVAGDESGWRAYGTAPYITAASDLGVTFGHKAFPGGGVSLQTAPEPHTVWTAPASGKPAAWDGQVRLATVETSDGEYGPTLMFLARWTDSLDAVASGGGAITMTSPDSLQPPVSSSVLDDANPGTLRPDGLYIEEHKVPGYPAMGSMASSAPARGVLSFWMKPNFDASRFGTGTDRTRRRFLFNNTRTDLQSNSATFFLAMIGTGGASFTTKANGPPTSEVFGFEGGFESSDPNESIRALSPRTAPHRWNLWNGLWDLGAGTIGNGHRFRLDRDVNPVYVFDYRPLHHGGTTLTGPVIDFTQPDGSTTTTDLSLQQTAFFFLGDRGYWNNRENFNQPYAQLFNYAPPDATMDEFAIYDFSSNNTTAQIRFNNLATNRFKAGRFYKGSAYPASQGLYMPFSVTGRNAGEYFSAPVLLGDGDVWLRTLAWTQIVPRGLCSPAGATPEDGDPLPDGRIALELAHENVRIPPASVVDAYATDAQGRALDTLFTDSRGQRVDRALRGGFRIHAVFQPNLSDPLETAILDPLTLDDVTVTYWPRSQPRISSWSPGE